MRSGTVLSSLALPLQPAPLLLVAIFAVLLRLAMHAGLLGLPMLLIVGSWFFKYAFVLLDHAAEGRPGAPVLAPEDANPVGEKRPLLYGLAIAAFYAATEALNPFVGDGAVSVLRLLALAGLPAFIATHALTGSLLASLNPSALLAMARRMGPGYLLIVGVAVTCWLLGRFVLLDAGHLAWLVRIALLMLLWLTQFAVIGGVMHARRTEIGYEPEHSPERTQGRQRRDLERERDRFIDQVFAEYRSGATTNALESIRQRIRNSAQPAEESLWILVRVAGWPNPKLANALARDALSLLLERRRAGDAIQVVKSRLQADPTFRPATAEQLLQLARLARDGGEAATARALVADFATHFPGHPGQVMAAEIAQRLQR